MIAAVLILGLIGLVAVLTVKALRDFIRAVWRVLAPFWLWFSGHSMDGQHRTNATWTKRSSGDRSVYDIRRGALRWHHLPRMHRAGYRTGGTVAVLVITYGLVTATLVTVVSLCCAAAVGFGLGVWRTVYVVRHWHHERHYVRPLEGTLLRGIHAPTTRLEVSRKGDVIQGVVIEWSPDTEIGPAEKSHVLESVTRRLAIENPDPKWELMGRMRTVVFTPTEPPPAKVALRDLRTAIEGSGPDEIVIGLGRRRSAVPIDLHSDSPHIALSIGSGGGKSIAARGMAVQVLRKGGLVVVLNAKKSAYNWTRGLPNVAHCKTIDAIAAMLIWLNAERMRREDVAERSGDIEDVVHADVGARILIVFEEQNLTVPKIKAADPEAYEALGDLNFAGRAARMNMVAIAQRYSAKAAGGGDVRATVNARILGRYEKSAWKMLAEQFPMPAPSNTPGRVQVVTDRVAEAQMPYTGGQEAHDYALSGKVALCPAGMPSRCAIGVPVPLGQLVKTGPEQQLSQGQAPDPALSPPRLIGLAEAVSEGVVSLSLAAVRKRRQRDPGAFPPQRDLRGTEALFDETELMEWEESRR